MDSIVCLSVNDAFVMDAWGRAQNAGDHVVMAADGNAEFTRALGLEFDASGFGMNIRAHRFAMIVDAGELKGLYVEEPMKFDVSSAESILEKL